MTKEEEPIDLDDLFEDEDFKGPNQIYRSLYAKIQRQKASRQDFVNLKPSERQPFLLYLVGAFQELTKQGTVKLDKLTKINSQRLERLINFVSLLESDEYFFILQNVGLVLMIETKMDNHPKMIPLLSALKERASRKRQ